MNILNIDSQKNNLYLLDEQFLNEMAEQKQRDIYARIISLDINENPIASKPIEDCKNLENDGVDEKHKTNEDSSKKIHMH